MSDSCTLCGATRETVALARSSKSGFKHLVCASSQGCRIRQQLNDADAAGYARALAEMATVHVEHPDRTVAPVVGFVGEIEDDGLIAAITAERDRLRAELDRLMDATVIVQCDHPGLEAERDAALASLAEARERGSWLTAELANERIKWREQTALRDAVVEAARAWREDGDGDTVREILARTDALIAAVDALDAGAAAGGTTRARFPTDACVAGRHTDCQGAEDGGPIYPGDVYLCVCTCHAAAGGEGGT